MARSGRFKFDGGAATYLGTAVLAVVITVCTLGICYPYALVLRERWRAKHSYSDGFQLAFTGSATGLFLNWIKWWLLSVVTLGIYLFWVGPRIQSWKWEHTNFAGGRQPLPLTDVVPVMARPVALPQPTPSVEQAWPGQLSH